MTKEVIMVWPGEEEAWGILSNLDAKDVTANAEALFNSYDSTYALTCFGQDIRISLGDYSRLSILRYLIHALDLPLSGRLVRPSDLPGGDIFTKGTHIIPLDKAAAYFSNHANEFLAVGQSLGGTQGGYGDMSLNILAFPRVPVVLILWSGEEEFPSTASMLFDSSCVSHLPPDIIWSTSMMALEMMLMNSKA